MKKLYNTRNSFSLQRVTIHLDDKDFENVKERVKDAMESYHWIFQNESKHDVLVNIEIKENFVPKKKRKKNNI